MQQKRDENREPSTPNRAANMEQAEGSRETVQSNVSEGDESTSTERGRESSADERGGDAAGGITNRELEREMAEQEQLPPRGEAGGSER